MAFCFLLYPQPLVGNPLNILFVIWWLLGSFGLYALVQSCASYGKTLPLPSWQRTGLMVGTLVTLPLVGFLGGFGIFGLLGVAASALVLATDRKARTDDADHRCVIDSNDSK